MKIKNTPKHVAIILDGNRRFAKRLLNHPFKGHEWGAKKIEALVDWAHESGIRELTLWAFSLENFGRPKDEFEYLMRVFKENFERLKDDKRIFENRIRIRVIGRIGMFPDDIEKAMRDIMELTKHHDKFIINFAMAYGGRGEIIDAVNSLAKDIKDSKLKPGQITNKIFENYLYMKDAPDLIIRTGGAKRTSGFLLWQSDYSEYIFLDKFWPDFEEEDFIKCLEEYSLRQRRFGK
ncbi:di-trans,poly-cis-decaprenylcistransferase [Candidatus Woesearchaeota archaeon]|nr:di-trans,poly-cis-decaprenylcistransferase [Candidatus Woesearchaeota archaeon]